MPTRRRNRRERRAIVAPQQVTFTVPNELRFVTYDLSGDDMIIRIGFGTADVTSAAEFMLCDMKYVDPAGDPYTLTIDTPTAQQVNLIAEGVAETPVYLLGYICVRFTDNLQPPIILDLNGVRPVPT